MSNRRKTLVIFGIGYFLLATSLFLGLKKIQKNFSEEKLDFVLSVPSAYRDKTDNLCSYRIIGDPERVGKKYVKVNFWCSNSGESRNTLSLEAIDDKTVKGVLTEYARIIGFDYKIIDEKNWICILNDQPITDLSTIVVDAATIDCFENKNLFQNKDLLKTDEKNS